MKKLNLGCGKDIKKGFINLDGVKLRGVNILHNLNKFNYPFRDGEFEYIEANHILEHLDDIPKVLRELWRISKNKGIIKIRSPHFSSLSAWTDLTHKHPFGFTSLDYMDVNKNHVYSHEYGEKEKFSIKKKLIFGKINSLLGIGLFANKCPAFYETHLAYIFPPKEIKFKLIVVK